jgi:hypothetical protein
MAEEITERVSRYILDGSDQDLRRLLSGAELGAENACAAFRRAGLQQGWNAIDCGCGPSLRRSVGTVCSWSTRIRHPN